MLVWVFGVIAFVNKGFAQTLVDGINDILNTLCFIGSVIKSISAALYRQLVKDVLWWDLEQKVVF
jgi:hypothetical protein